MLKGRWAVTKGAAYKHQLKRPDSPWLPSTGAGRGHTDTSSSSLCPLWEHATSCTSLMEAPSHVGCERTASWISSLADSGCLLRFASHVSAEGRSLQAIWSSTTGREVWEVPFLWLVSTFCLWCLFPECVSALLLWFFLSHLVSIWSKQLVSPFKITHLPLSSLHAMFSVLKRFFIWTETDWIFFFFKKGSTCVLIWVHANSLSRATGTHRTIAVAVFAALAGMAFHSLRSVHGETLSHD